MHGSGNGHIPVLLDEVVSALDPRAGAVIVDGTYGAGGYARALLSAVDCHVWGIDRDGEAIRRAAPQVAEFAPRLRLIHGRFGDMAALLARENVHAVDGVVLDLGVSSNQLEEAERGFSFRADGPLDMRMGADGLSAADVVNSASEKALADIIFGLGEERFARRIARAIVRARNVSPLRTTRALAEVVRAAVPRSAHRAGARRIDPATRTFQALRIHVNDELGELDRGLTAAEALLRAGGTLVVVSFHSLEDRRVKRFLRSRSEAQGGPPSRHLPAFPPGSVRRSSFSLLQRRAIRPSPAEIARNPRARSARLRAAQRTDAPAWPMGEAA